MFILQGVLRIHLLEAQNLVAKDNLMGGMVKGKSDPYVKIDIGGIPFKSRVIKENLNPTWNEMYEVRSPLHCLRFIACTVFLFVCFSVGFCLFVTDGFEREQRPGDQVRSL